MTNNNFRLGLVLIWGWAMPLHAQTWTWPNCTDVTQSNFSEKTLVQNGAAPDPNLREPVHMAFDMDSAGHVDIYYVERGGGSNQKALYSGDVKRYLAASNTVQTLITLPTFAGPLSDTGMNLEDGATGIALDPDFKTNRFVYVYYSPASKSVFRLSRFTLANNALGSEKIMLEIPEQREYCCHTGGAMTFDAYGDLWIGVGANTGTGGGATQGINETDQNESEERGAGNTHNLRGSILRIHPDNSAQGYGIPAGNFGDYFAQQTGDSQYADTSKVSPEIYLKGMRNPYSVAVDPVRRWLFIGDVGPDKTGLGGTNQGTNTEADDMVTHPAFMGWPYFSGNNVPMINTTRTESVLAPTNTSKWNTGLTVLPASTPGAYDYNEACAVTGSLYRYDGALQNTIKFPPHFTRKWFITDFNNSQIQVLTPDSTGSILVGGPQRIFSNFTFYEPIDLQMGPDGAMYIINYAGYFTAVSNTSIVKITYTGSCFPTAPTLEQPSTGIELNPAAHYVSQPNGWVVNLGSNTLVLVPNGMAGFKVFNLMGQKIWEIRNLREGENFSLPANLPHGALQYRWIPE